ncbi:hypothetical protein [Burkholderia sp. BDU5]|uniref:hypothetical protein n=1 Tax=Burkholderia sp. BDU5 TaxID=1385590 RepID=UPI00075DAB01|nr:hypothetical protein [Burkholderia sp. BDU5]KVE35865.1 hypothetical protein WS69_14650 [Burkholderia sp. BDU5]
MQRCILVVDDELAGLRKVHVEGTVPDFYETIADTTDPKFESLCEVAKAVAAAQQFVGDEDSAGAYFQTDDAVRDVLLSVQFDNIASEELKDLLEPFLARSRRVSQLKNDFLTAFPASEFIVKFVGAPRPILTQIAECDTVFLDLFLEDGDDAPVDGVQKYLRELSANASNLTLPPIVLMSTHNELNEHKRNFSAGSQISAAGLMVLPKAKIAEPQFRAAGLRLSFDQLSRQSSVAHSMRAFIQSWMNALMRATEETSKTLWNLDASAMQQIHLTSIRDDDPYDEHLNELLSREYLFRVESDSDVGAKIKDLDAQFRSHFAADGKELANRLIAPMTDVDTSRSLMSHFTWLGVRPTLPFMCYFDEESAERVSRSLPFGSVLCGPTLAHDTQCWVHITQQCDLNGISRARDANGTLIFAVAEARELQPSDNPTASTTDLVARSLQIDEGGMRREFDLRVRVGELRAMPLRSFIAQARHERLRIIGRLRSDIAHQIVAATTNHMSRPASQLMLRPALLRSKVFLQSNSLRNGRTPLLETAKKARVFSLTQERDLYSFQDDACVEISLWLARELSQLNINVAADPLCTALRKGWRSDKQLPGGILAKVREWVGLDEAYKALENNDVANGQVQLTVVFER